jgi:RHH-type proline utilization regulon transcriptional repressor/proline dehydrogenase/delta 1-pyrroline-5-carboxylate dehydrogenase
MSAYEKRERRNLTWLLDNDKARLFSTALTDRFYRSSDPVRAVNMMLQIVDRTNCMSELPLIDRLQLGTARIFGPAVPTVTAFAVASRVRSESLHYLWLAESAQLKKNISHSSDSFDLNLNLLGEEVLGYQEASHRLAAYQELASQYEVSALSLKLSSLDPHLDVLDFEGSVQRCVKAASLIIESSSERSGASPLFYFDMESYHDLELTEAVLGELLLRFQQVKLGIAIQAYLPESMSVLERLAQISLERGAGAVPLRVRLVKGANLQMERVESSTHGWQLPIFLSKAEVDAHFKRVMRRAVEWCDLGAISLGVASHNLFDISYALLLQSKMLCPQSLHFEMLHGMVGHLGHLIQKMSGSLLVYVPVVPQSQFNSAVSYLVRRLDENTAPDNYLRHAPQIEPGSPAFFKQAELFIAALAASNLPVVETRRRQSRSTLALGHQHLAELDDTTGVRLRGTSSGFNNCADTDWTRSGNRSWLKQALTLQAQSNPKVEPILEGKFSQPYKLGRGFDPSRPNYTYSILWATSAHLAQAIDVSASAATQWASTSIEHRTQCLLRAAALIESQRGALIAAMVLDAGKLPREADYEVSEAVDFAHYYANDAKIIEGRRGRGVIAVISPWNFPLAIALGGVFAGILGGNSVILKPSPDTPWVAQLAVKICHEAGIPRNVLQFLPIQNEDAGQLIDDERIDTIVLTGASSTARNFLRRRPGLRLLAETGGKNAMYVGAVSDRDAVVSSIVNSAFGHAGQKCSALSVLLLNKELAQDESFKQQLVDAAGSLKIGSAWDSGVQVTPLIRPALGPLKKVLDSGESYGSWALKPTVDPKNPRLLSPGILWDVKVGSYPHQTELFAPILSVVIVEDLPAGLQALNQSPYGLTAGIHSLSESEQEVFVQSADAGNLYINREITGAIVGRQPFGGRKASSYGAGHKAGGPDYLLQFTREAPDKELTGEVSQEVAMLAERSEDYKNAFEVYFSKLHSGTQIVGENNWWRYQPGACSLVIADSCSDLDIASSLLARSLAACDYMVFATNHVQAMRIREIADNPDLALVVADGPLLAEQAAQWGAERLRVIGKPSIELLKAAVNHELSIITEPVASTGRQEIGYFLSCQAISFSNHRHGNISLAGLSRLESILEGQ